MWKQGNLTVLLAILLSQSSFAQQGHYDALSKHWPTPKPNWPANHDESISRLWPSDDGWVPADDLALWPPNHYIQFSKNLLPPKHAKATSKIWTVHPNHYKTVSDSWGGNHGAALSHQWPSNHFGVISVRGVPPLAHYNVVSQHGGGPPLNHIKQISSSWPADHEKVRSEIYPPNHFQAISRHTINPPRHNKTRSFFYPPGHIHAVSKYRPPGGVGWPAGHSTPISQKDGEVPDEPWPPWPDGHDYTTTIKTWTDIATGAGSLVPTRKPMPTKPVTSN